MLPFKDIHPVVVLYGVEFLHRKHVGRYFHPFLYHFRGDLLPVVFEYRGHMRTGIFDFVFLSEPDQVYDYAFFPGADAYKVLDHFQYIMVYINRVGSINGHFAVCGQMGQGLFDGGLVQE